MKRAVSLAGLLGQVACASGDRQDAGDTEQQHDASEIDELVELHDDNAVHVDVDLSVEVRRVAAGEDLELRWDKLRMTDLGLPLDALGPVTRVELYQFADHSPDELVEALREGDLQQRDVGLNVSCEPEDDHCELSDFVFQHGHGVDVAAAMHADSGTWLVSLYVGAYPIPVAQVLLDPSDTTGRRAVQLDDRCSHIEVSPTGEQTESLAVPASGLVSLSWKTLTTTSAGQPLDPDDIDVAVLAAVPAGTSPEVLTLRLIEEAEQVWGADLRGLDTLFLPDVVPIARTRGRFTGIDPQDDTLEWYLGLYSRTNPLHPQVQLIPLSPG